MTKLFRRSTGGFTLIELLVVISIIAILAAVLVPAVADALTNGKMTGTLNNGKQIFAAVFAKVVSDVVTPSASGNWPDAARCGWIMRSSPRRASRSARAPMAPPS